MIAKIAPCGFATKPSITTSPIPFSPPQKRVFSHVCRVRQETAEQALQRRLRESEQLDEKIITVTSIAELDAEIDRAGKDKLLVIEVSSDSHCMLDEQHELEPAVCQKIHHSFARTARDCPDALFIEAVVDSLDDDLAESLGVNVLPTLQFVKDDKLLWEHKGITNLDQDLAEGVLFYGDAGGQGMHPSDFITEIKNPADLDKWKSSLGDKVLGVLDVSTSNTAACVHIFPTVVVLARQFKGFANFARLMGDTDEETKALMKALNISHVPTFRFYRGGEGVGQHVGTSRSELISAILGKQAELGLAPPPPQESRSERRKHAIQDARAAEKAKPKKRWNSIF